MPDLEHSFSRRNLLRLGATLGLSSFLPNELHAKDSPHKVVWTGDPAPGNETGSQRLSIERSLPNSATKHVKWREIEG